MQGCCPHKRLRPWGGGRGSPCIKVSGTERGVGGLGQASHPHPRTAKCVSWTRIQGNCVSPHSVCSEANAFLSYCLCRSLVVDTPITSSLGERPRCSESGCGRPDSKQGERQPGGSILVSRGRSTGHGHAARSMPRVEPRWLLGMPPCGVGKRVPIEGPVGLP